MNARSVRYELILFNNGDSLLNYLNKEHADLILLDIMMPFLTGMEVAHIIRKNRLDVKFVFLTSTPEFALESYDVEASGYLIKPPVFEKLSALFDRLLLPEDEGNSSLLIKIHAGYHRIDMKDIECMEAQGKNVVFHMADGTDTEALGKFSDYEGMLLQNDRFFKCHRSYIVGLAHIKNFTVSEACTCTGLSLPIARGLGSAFKDAYFKFMFRS